MTSLSRRNFLRNAALLGGAIAFPWRIFADEKNDTDAQNDITKTPLTPLPCGSVKANDWLETQLKLQARGITGRMEDYPDYSEKSAWRGGDGEDWERGPYYVRGLVALAFVLNDTALKKKARVWIDWSLDSQREDGFFGPKKNDAWWARMPMLTAIRDYYDATGKSDARVLPFLEKYFRYQISELPKRPLSNWGDARGADNIDSVIWLYCEKIANGTDAREAAWLLDLARLLQKQTQRWSDDFTNGTVRFHVVNTTQALKYPSVVHRFSRDEKDRRAFENGTFNWHLDHGRIDGLPNSDEAARDNQSTRGTESCAVVEALLSTEIALRDFGDAALGDYLEQIAYNALPLTTTPDFSGHTYYALQNQVMATHGVHGFDCDHGDSCAFGAPAGFDCCFANHHMGWAKFVQHMWMKNDTGGLALIAYGPNSLTTKIGGKTVSFAQETHYPFREKITLHYTGDTAEFPLDLRIPAWAENISVQISDGKNSRENGTGAIAGTFLRLRHEFKNGDKIHIHFKAKIEHIRCHNDTVAVKRGPLLYALDIEEDWRICEDNDAREIKVASLPEQPLREVFPASKWNFGLILDENDTAKNLDFTTLFSTRLPPQPWSAHASPLKLRVPAQIIPEWHLEGNKTAPQPLGPVLFDETQQKINVTLIPYGCGRLKISHFPHVVRQNDFMKRTAATAKKWHRRGEEILEFENIIVPPAANYLLKISAGISGGVSLEMNGKKIAEIELKNGTATLANLRDLIAEEPFKFKAGNYNNLRFAGANSAKITAIEIVPSEGIPSPEIAHASAGADFFELRTNITRALGTYRVFYGTDEKNPASVASGFENEVAKITGLKNDTEYFFRVEARLNGRIETTRTGAIRTGAPQSMPPRQAGKPEILAVASAFECVQIKFARQRNISEYKIEYGEKSGKYTHAIYGVRPNGYKGGGIFSAEKFAVGNLKNGRKYFFRLIALRENHELAASEEISATPGFRARVDAKGLAKNDTANQMDVEVALKIREIAVEK